MNLHSRIGNQMNEVFFNRYGVSEVGDNITEFTIVKDTDPRVGMLIVAALMIIVGLVLVAFKKEALKWILIGIGIVFIVAGVYAVYKGLTAGAMGNAVIGAIGLVIGLALAISPNFFETLLMVILAAVLIIIGIMNLFAAVNDTFNSKIGKILTVVVAVLMIIMGVYALLNTGEAADTVMLVIGIFMIISGAIDVAGAVQSK